jgi:hypothetical protein
MSDGGVVPGDAWEVDADERPYKAFRCAFLREEAEGCATTCTLRERFPRPDPEKPEENRPLHCGEFPVFGPIGPIIEEHGQYIPATGAFPRCTWYGIRIVKDAADAAA